MAVFHHLWHSKVCILINYTDFFNKRPVKCLHAFVIYTFNEVFKYITL